MFLFITNPTTGRVMVDLGTQALDKVLVYDMTGRVILEQQDVNGETQTELNLTELSNSMYIIRVQSGDAWHMERVAVQR